MPYLPLKSPEPTDGDAVATAVMDALDVAMPIVPQPQNYNGPYPQGIDIKQAYKYEGITQAVLDAQYIRAARFYGGGTPDQNSAARTACFTQNHSNSELIARWCMINGATPITAEYLGITDQSSQGTTDPLHEVKAALAATNAAVVALNQTIGKL